MRWKSCKFVPPGNSLCNALFEFNMASSSPHLYLPPLLRLLLIAPHLLLLFLLFLAFSSSSSSCPSFSCPSPSPKMHLVKYSSQWKFGRNHSVSNLASYYLIGDYVFALSSSLSIYFSHQIVGFLSHEKIIAWSPSVIHSPELDPDMIWWGAKFGQKISIVVDHHCGKYDVNPGWQKSWPAGRPFDWVTWLWVKWPSTNAIKGTNKELQQ